MTESINTNQIKPRMKWVDNAKGIAMFSVILGHCLEYINSDMGCSLLLLPAAYSVFFQRSSFLHGVRVFSQE